MVSTIKGDRPANQFGAGAIIVKPQQAQKNPAIPDRAKQIPGMVC